MTTRRKEPQTTEQFRATESEAAFQTWCCDLLTLRQWKWAHVTDSRRQQTDGLPDIVAARGGVVLLIELKTARGKTTDEQDAWLAASGGHLFRPSQREEFFRLVW